VKSPQRVLELLYDREGPFALAELAAAAGVSRNRLDDVLGELARRQRLDSSPAGVWLVRPVALDAHLIERGLNVRRVGRSAICFDEVGSTNDVAFDSARQADADGLVVLAESQRAGRGRLGRTWISPPGTNILLSAVLLGDRRSLPHEAVTIAAGLAAAEGVAESCQLDPQLKWPNDVLLDGRKLAGVLVEVRTVARRRATVVGLGLNANAAPSDERVDRPATSLADHLHAPVERVEVVRAILRRLDEWVARVMDGRLDELHAAWLARCGMINERVTVQSKGWRQVGRVLDVSPLEGLILAGDDGRTVHIPAEGATLIDDR